MLEKILKWTVLGGVFALPFIVFLVSLSLFFPYITGKNFAFRIIVEVAAAAWIALALVNHAYRPREKLLLAAFAVFVLIMALANAFGVMPFKSFWSNFERMDGWLTLAHLFAYFVVASSVLSTEKLWRTFWHVTLAVAVVVGAYALLQLSGVASLVPGFSSTARLDATFGNPIYLAAYMLFHAFIAALFLAREWHENRPPISTTAAVASAAALQVCALVIVSPVFQLSAGRGLAALLVLSAAAWVYAFLSFGPGMRARAALAAPFALFVVILLLTGTRGAMLGLAGGAVLAALLFALRGREYSSAARRAAALIVAVAVVLAGGIFLVKDQEWARNAPVLGRLATISLSQTTAQARMMNWGMAWEGVKERPFLGWGQEGYIVVFSKYYNPNMYGQEQWFDRVHNIIFDWLVAGGILGLFAYLSLFALVLFYLWRRSTDGTSIFTVAEASILTGLLAAYVVLNLTVFDNIASYLLFVSVLAYVAFRAGEHAQSPQLFAASALSRRALPLVTAFVVVFLSAGIWYVNVRPIAANKVLIQAITPQKEGIAKNLEYFEKAVAYNTLGIQEVREQLMQATLRIAGVSEIPLEVKQRFLELSARELSRQAQESPLDPRALYFLGTLLDVYGLYAEANPILERAHALSPAKQTIILERAANAIARNDFDSALALYKQAFELAPDFREARLLYAAAAIRIGNDALADELLAPLVTSGRAVSAHIASAYADRGRFDKIISIWRVHVELHPDDVEARFMLAGALYANGNSQMALSEIQWVIDNVPTARTLAEALMRDIRSGALRIE